DKNFHISSAIQWTWVFTRRRYQTTIGSNCRSKVCFNNKDLGNVTSYTPVADFPEAATIYVRIVPYNKAGNATGCSEEHFSTEKRSEERRVGKESRSLNKEKDVNINTGIKKTDAPNEDGNG